MKRHRFNISGGFALNCLDYGGEGKPPILFLHGGSAHAHWWDFVAPAFTDNFHPLALDQRGHGDSEWPQEWEYGTRHYLADLTDIIESWGLGDPILVGHSMGAHNALMFAAGSRRPRAIVAIDSLPDYSERAVAFLRTFAEKPARRFASIEEAVAKFRLLPRETIAKREIIEHIARLSFRQLDDGEWTHKLDRRTLIREPLRVWEVLPKIECPALMVRIPNSPVLSREDAEKMAAALPKGRLAEIADSHHHAMLDNPMALIAVLRDFFREIP